LPVYAGPTAEELAQRPSAADALRHEGVPEIARAYIAGGDPKQAPPELVAVLGDVRFRCDQRQGAMAISHDGKQLAITNDRREIRFFDMHTGQLLRNITPRYTPNYRMVFTPDGKRLAGTSYGDRHFYVIDAETGKLVWQRKAVGESGVQHFTFSANGKVLLLSTSSGKGPSQPALLLKCDPETG